MDWMKTTQAATLSNNPPQLTRRQVIIIRTIGVVVACAFAWQIYFHLLA